MNFEKTAVKALATTTVGKTKGIVTRDRMMRKPLNSYLEKRKIAGKAKRIDRTVESAACHKVNQTISQKDDSKSILRIGLKKAFEVFAKIFRTGIKKKKEK